MFQIMPHEEAGKLRILLISHNFSMYPNVQTITEVGGKQELLSACFGLFDTAGIGDDV